MGIGASIARRLAEDFKILVLVGRSSEKLSKLAKKLTIGPGVVQAFGYAVDPTDHEQLSRTMRKVVETLGRPVDVLINNADLALGFTNDFDKQRIADITTMVNVNLNSFMYAIHTVLNAGGMLAAREGRIINITSECGVEYRQTRDQAVYHTTKAAQEAFTKAIRMDLNKTNIKVLAVRIGEDATNLHGPDCDKETYDGFMEGDEPLAAHQVKDAVEVIAWALRQPEWIDVKTMDAVKSQTRNSLSIVDGSYPTTSWSLTPNRANNKRRRDESFDTFLA